MSNETRVKVAILAAGYGTRLEQDLASPSNVTHRHLIGTPKPLLPVMGVPLITHWITHFASLTHPPAQVVVVVNDLHYHKYEAWQRSLPSPSPPVLLLNEGSRHNEGRRGAVACIKLVTDTDTDACWVVVGGDTLLHPSFSVGDMVSLMEQLQKRQQQMQHQQGEQCPVSIIVSTSVRDEDVSKGGIIEVDGQGKVVSFLEKPEPHATPSRLQSPCVYLLHHLHLHLLQEFLDAKAKLLTFLSSV
ncbi:uncharacterized protein LOC108676451 [Hyalella azteca]|uniref:Uncharacterized protein LOC108676451 n=1 Tax=Hyalella azteca TaxID=294128 RepID=A0A8B7P228_HYAAZ|nr:uncharacterized protein LOC108676451 [Hyalella azteca]